MLLLSPAFSRDWIVHSETGSDAANGTESAPLATVQAAVDRSAAGDRIILLPAEAIYRQSIDLSQAPEGLVIDGNKVTLDGGGTSEHGVFSNGATSNVKIFHLGVSHCTGDGFAISGKGRGWQFFDIKSEQNGGSGFSLGNSVECWIRGGNFANNHGSAFTTRDQAESFLEECHFQGSGEATLRYEGGRHSIENSTLGPTSSRTYLTIQGNPTADGTCSLVVRNLHLQPGTQTDAPGDGEAKMRIQIGSGASVYHDAETQPLFASLDVIVHPAGELLQSLYRTFSIGRKSDGSPLMAWAGGGTRQFPSTAYRILHFGKHVPQEIAPKLSPENDWLGLLEPLDTRGFPPQGSAFSPEHSSAHAIWRWIGLCAPDAVFVPDTPEGRALGAALQKSPPAGVGNVDVFLAATGKDGQPESQVLSRNDDGGPPAKDEMRARVSRSAREVLSQLAAHYGNHFSGAYTQALTIIARKEAGLTQKSKDLAKDYLQKHTALPKSGGDIAGTLLYATIDEDWARSRVLAVANMAFHSDGTPLEAMPLHQEMSDAIFMASPLLVEAGRISGEKTYWDQAVRNIRFIQSLCLRPDGLYRHSPQNTAAWGRGNGFPALGLALTLQHLPTDHPDREGLITAFQAHLNALAPHQDSDGMWHQIIDHPDSYAELTATSMIAYAIACALDVGWLEESDGWRTRLDAAWASVKMHVSTDGETLLNVCTGTGKQETLEDYYQREAILGPDERGAAMVMLLAAKLGDRY